MSTVKAPTVSQMEEIRGLSLDSMTWDNGAITFKNKAGEVVSTFQIRNPDGIYVPAIKRISAVDYKERDVLIRDWYDPTGMNKHLDIYAPPTREVYDVAWSPDGRYLAVANGPYSPYTIVYRRDANYMTDLSAFVSPPPAAYSVTWSPDGQYLAFAIPTSPYLRWYRRDGDVFTQMANPTGLPSSSPSKIRWSPNGQYLIMTHSTSKVPTIYSVSSGTLTKLVSPILQASQNVECLEWSPNSEYLVFGFTDAPYLSVYKRTLGVFDLITDLPGPPTDQVSGVDWSFDSKYFAHTSGWAASQGQVQLYKFASSGISKMTPPPDLSGRKYNSLAWSPDARYLVASGYMPAGFTYDLFKRSGDELQFLNTHTDYSSTAVVVARWSADGKHLALGAFASPYLSVVKSRMGSWSGPVTRLTESP